MTSALLADPRFRFLVAGGSAALVNWLVRFPLSHIMPYPAAVGVALAIGMAYGFVIYRHWAFGSSGGRSILVELRDFLVVNAAGAVVTFGMALAVQFGLSMVMVDTILAEGLAHATGIACGAIVNYLGHKHITFRA